jgi:hypothetical protein
MKGGGKLGIDRPALSKHGWPERQHKWARPMYRGAHVRRERCGRLPVYAAKGRRDRETVREKL